MQWTESERAAWLTVQEHNLDALLDVSQARADMSLDTWTQFSLAAIARCVRKARIPNGQTVNSGAHTLASGSNHVMNGESTPHMGTSFLFGLERPAQNSSSRQANAGMSQDT